MAIFHLSMKAVQRSKGRSATAAAAYRSGERIKDLLSEKVFDFSRKQGVCHTGIIVPEGETAPSRAELWNSAEAAEKRSNAQTAKEYEIALPSELTAAQRIELAEDLARALAKRYGCALDVCIHEPSHQGDQRNFHAHIMATTRVFRGGQLAEKTDLDIADRDRKKKGLPSRNAEIKELRQELADLTNKALERAGRPERVDARSFKDQGRDDEPTIHKGPAVTAMERQGVQTEIGKAQEELIAQRAECQKLQRKAAAIVKAKALLLRQVTRKSFAHFLEQETPRLEGKNTEEKRLTARRLLENFDSAKTEEERQNVQKAAQEQVALHKNFMSFIDEKLESVTILDGFDRRKTIRDFDSQDTTEGREAIFTKIKDYAAELEAEANQRAAEEKDAFKRFTEKLEENRPYLGKTEQEQKLAFHSYQRMWQSTKQGQRPAFEEKVFTVIGEAKEQSLQLQKEQEQKAALVKTAEERDAFKRRLNQESRGVFVTLGKRMAFEKKCMEAWDKAPDANTRKQLEEETFKALQKAREQDRGR